MDDASNAFARIGAGIFALRRAESAPALVVAIASAVRREGRSFVALGLARHLALLGADPVLLVDADLASPALSRCHAPPGQAGLTELLRGETPDLVASGLPNLHLLAAGRQAEPALLLRDGALARFLGWARSEPRLILLDLPPLAEPLAELLVGAADRTILVVDASRTARSAAQAAARQIPPERALGVVHNRRPAYAGSDWA